MRIFTSSLLWNGFIRAALFWAMVALGLAVSDRIVPYSNWKLAGEVVSGGDIARLTSRDFAFALSSAIVQLALALAWAFLIAHVVLLRAALWGAKLDVGRGEDPRGFAARLDTVSGRLRRNAVIGPAWREFEKTTIRHDDAVHNTIRPQAFINLADARERLFGLKMMGSIPGFFVGLGLLLTFIGLVLALNEAASTTGAKDPAAMSEGLAKLLNAATFKFSTSIAGLGTSLLLSLLFRTYQIWIDAGFYDFCRALEEQLQFHPTQKIAAESRDILAATRDELKEINSERFFGRLGESIAPRLEGALSAAVRPMTDRLDSAMGELTRNSQSGLDEMLQGFLRNLNGSAGIELGEVTRSLDAVRVSLESVQRNLSGSGADFAQRMTEASQVMARVAVEASQALGSSATGAAGAVETAMADVSRKLEAQTASFGNTLAGLQAGLAAQAEEGARASREAGVASAAASRLAAEEASAASIATAREAAEAVRSGMGEVVASLREDIERLSESLRSVASAFAGQTQQIETVSARSRDTAQAFGQVASDVRAASQPLLASSERVAGSTDRMAASIESSVGALAGSQAAADAMAERLSAHLEQIGRVWEQYEARFKGVDEDFGRAAERFHDEVSRHQEAMGAFVVAIDKHTSSIVEKLNSGVAGLSESVESLNETLDGFLEAMASRD